MRRLVLLALASILSFGGLAAYADPQAGDSTTGSLAASIEVTYSASTEARPVGEARMPIPTNFPVPEGVVLLPSGGEFRFQLRCNTSLVDCTSEQPTVRWDFGDGTTSVGSVVATHSYATPGVYRVRADASTASATGRATTFVYVSPHFGDLHAEATYQSVVLGDGATGLWSFDNSSDDGSGISSSAALLGDASYLPSEGIAQTGNLALHLADAGAAARVEGFSGFASGGIVANATAELWVRADGGSGQILSYADGAFRISNPRTLTFEIAGGDPVQTDLDIADGRWHHLVVSWQPLANGRLTVWVDGSQRFSTTGVEANASLPPSGDLVVGDISPDTFFVGAVDEVATYSRHLTDATVDKHYRAGLADTVGDARPDRPALWTVGALGLLDPCGVTTSGAGFLTGRPLFCPEPAAPSGYTVDLAVDAKNGLSGQSCLEAPSVCDLPAEYFTGDPETTEANLIAAGYLNAEGDLIVRPDACGDGWAVKGRSPTFSAVAGLEAGCLTRNAFYDALVRGVDGRDSGHADLDLDTSNFCVDGASDVMRRARRLGVASLRERNGNEFCDENHAITRREAYVAAARLLGLKPVGCPTVLRDLYDPNLDGAGQRDPDCGLITAAIEDGRVVLTGDVTCPDNEGVCFNPDRTLTRAQGAAILASLAVNDMTAVHTLTLTATAEIRPVNTPVVVTAEARAPLTVTGDAVFTFPAGEEDVERQCEGRVTVPFELFGESERRAVATCTYEFQRAAEQTLHLTVEDSSGQHTASFDLVVVGINTPPSSPTGDFPLLSESGEAVSSTFSSTDFNNQNVSFRASRTGSDQFYPSILASYWSTISSDNPLGWWRLRDLSGPSAAAEVGQAGAYTGMVSFSAPPLAKPGGQSDAAVRFASSWELAVAANEPLLWLTPTPDGYVYDLTGNTTPYLRGAPEPLPTPAGRPALSFARHRDTVVVPSALPFSLTGEWAVELSVRAPSGTADTTLLSLGAPASGLVVHNPSKLSVTLGGSTYATSANIADGQWHHLLISHTESGDLEVFVDGNSAATFSNVSSPVPGSVSLWVASHPTGGDAFDPAKSFRGDLGAVVFYDRAFAPSEAALQAGRFASQPPRVSFDPGDANVLELWFQPDQSPISHLPQVVAVAGSEEEGFAVLVDDRNLYVAAYDEAGAGVSAHARLAHDGPHHLVVVDGPAPQVFVNAAPVSTLGGLPELNNQDLYVGAAPFPVRNPLGPAALPFAGSVDEVATFGELSADRIRLHAETGHRAMAAVTGSGKVLGFLHIEEIPADPVTEANITFRPAHGDTSGSASVFLVACDLELCSGPRQRTITVLPSADAPTLLRTAGLISATEEGPPAQGSAMLVDLSDVGWDDFTASPATEWRIHSGPQVGTVQYQVSPGVWQDYTSGVASTASATLRYLPEGRPHGDGRFPVRISVIDSGHPDPSESAPTLIWVEVANTNAAPVCSDETLPMVEDTAASMDIPCFDFDSDPLTYEITTPPAHANVTINGDGFSVVPEADFCGTDTFTFTAFDGDLVSQPATLILNVACVNDPPTTPTVSIGNTTEDSSGVTGTVSTTDVDGGPIWTFQVLDGGGTWRSGSASTSAGTWTLTSNGDADKSANLTFVPAANWCGTATTSVRVNDSAGGVSGTRSVSVNVTCVNDAPTQPSPATMPTVQEDGANAVRDFTWSDPDDGMPGPTQNHQLHFSTSSSSGFSTANKTIAGGTASVTQLSGTAGRITINPGDNWCGSYTFYVRAYDGHTYGPVRTVTGSVTCVNDPPSAPNAPFPASVVEDNQVSRTVTGSDVDSNQIYLQIKQWSADSWVGSSSQSQTILNLGGGRGRWVLQQGSLSDSSATLRYEPAPNYITADGATGATVYMRWCDTQGACSGATYQEIKVTGHRNTVAYTSKSTACSPRAHRWYISSTFPTNSWTSPIFCFGSAPDDQVPVTGDWDGDGWDEFGLAYLGGCTSNPSQPRWHTNMARDTNADEAASSAICFGLNTDGVYFTGDWNGDGDDDLAVYRASNTTVYKRDRQTGGVSSFSASAVGSSNLITAAGGNANGAGPDELFIHRTNDIRWWIYNASGSLHVASFTYGWACSSANCSHALAGDWDGNGTDTVGYYVPSAGVTRARNANSSGSNSYDGSVNTGHASANAVDNPR